MTHNQKRSGKEYISAADLKRMCIYKEYLELLSPLGDTAKKCRKCFGYGLYLEKEPNEPIYRYKECNTYSPTSRIER